MTREMDRRAFIKRLATGGGGLVLGVWLAGCTDREVPVATTVGPEGTTTAPPVGSTATAPPSTVDGDPAVRFAPHMLLRIDGTGAVTVTIPKSEMGQGVRTALAMIVAEELDAEWSRVAVETAPGDRTFGDQVTGGSLSISSRYEGMRRVGARARQMLIAAAATQWGIDPGDCITEPGAVVERSGERRSTYGELAEAASVVEPPRTAELTFKDPADYRILGRSVAAIDAPDIVTGAAVYGSDVRVPGLRYAVVARPPVIGARGPTFDATEVLAMADVEAVVAVSTGVAVVATSTWAALRGRDALTVEWESPGDTSIDGASVVESLRAQLDPITALPGELTAEYTTPFAAHAAMEPLSCVASVVDGRCEVWAATQDPQLARAIAGRGSRLATDEVSVHVPLIGGGFGRRLDQDFVEEAAEVAAAVGGPVMVTWSRTDDLRHDRLHPAAVMRAVGHPADPGGIRIERAWARNGPVPTGDWRSVSNAPDAFARESFLDELAHAAGADPYEYRRAVLDDRARATLDAVAAAAAWGETLPAGSGRGIAHHATWGVSPTSVVAEVAVAGDAIEVTRVVCAIDCGVVINPDTVTAQLEGAVAFALSTALLGGVEIMGGAVTATNFHDAPILRFDAMPEVEVHIVQSDAAPTGVGEAGVPPVAPAVANAVFAATGVRLRDLPLSLG